MASIFDLITDPKYLASSNQGTSRMEYDQKPPTRDVTTTNFSNGAIHIKWQSNGSKWWVPNRSYLRIRCQLTRGDDTPVLLNDGVAPNMGIAACLFQSADFKINDKLVSRISEFMPQVDALATRLTKSRSWLNGIGNSVNCWADDFKIRQTNIAADGNLIQDLTNVPIVPLTKLELGFEAVHTAAYVNATGVITFAVGGGGALPADVRVVFPVGSYITFTDIAGVGPTDDRIGVPMLIVAGGSATTLQVAPRSLSNDIAAGAQSFVKTTQQNVNIARKSGYFELIWTPPLSIFTVSHAMPSGKYELILNPQTSAVYQVAAIESLLTSGASATIGNAVNQFKFNVIDMFMYVNTVEGPRADNITYLLDLEQTRCQTDKIDSTAFQQKNWDVSPSSYALTVAYQDLRAGSDTRVSASRFKSYNAGLTASQETGLNRFFINYAGQSLPNPDADPIFTSTTDYTTQRYIESQIYSGSYYDAGGGESLQEYHNRGSYYYFSWPRDGTDRSTRVNVHQAFAVGTDVTNMRVLLFDHSRQIARIRVQDGRVIDVQVEDA